MSEQIAKLFIRGSLVNITAKNLTEEQKSKAQDLMFIVWNDPSIDSARTEFCSILRRTISNEYLDKDFALAEIWITFWRAAVDVLYHSPKIKDKSRESLIKWAKKYCTWLDRRDKILTNQIIRKKYFKTYLYMYMRQIINENKIRTRLIEKTISGPSNDVAKDLIKFYLDNNTPKQIEYSISNNIFYCDTNIIPIKTLQKICNLKKEMKNSGVRITINENSITITYKDVTFISKKVTDKERAKFNSMNGFDDDTKNNFQQHCEYQAINNMENKMNNIILDDIINEMNNRLSPQSQKIFELMINPTKEFLDHFYPNRKKEIRPKELHIAQWLRLPKNEVSKCIDIIKKQAIALDIRND